MTNDHNTLLRTAFDAYLVQLDGGGLEPSESYLPYDFEQIRCHPWRTLGAEMVENELREMTNILNYWLKALRRWGAWNKVITEYGEEDAWDIRSEFFEALVHQCLLQPSATRDALTFVVTNSMHQVRLMLGNGYLDHLAGDPVTHDQRPINLTRRDKEKRLSDLIKPWRQAQFMTTLHQLDDTPYREATSDYRNRSSHAIGPRLAIGTTRTVVRSVEPFTEFTKKSDGTYERTRVAGRMSVCYAFGGTPPLDMVEVFAINLKQFRCARACYESYRRLLSVGVNEVSSVRPAF
ncbi:hypothetical protein RCH06_000956 [Polaromonas sp. CG_9.5]|uniref:hypothetical protein n=1 Tax=Polaromonas sp. CG_9.5 TaxID=3071705 RepID=UPI002DFDBC06|nr:hypothetical protein [Polaromonas sp. CG_9.5]